MSTERAQFIEQLAHASVLVVGCGLSGVSAARFAHACGARVRVVDTRAEPPGAEALARDCPQASLIVGDFNPAVLEGVTHMVVSPGVDLREPLIDEARRRGLDIVGDIEWFARVVNAPVVAITGSNGKSTVTAWVGEIARQAGLNHAIGGNFGTPALDLLTDDIDLYVLELSSFQLELTRSLAADAATVLNVSADHIDRHGDIEHYAALKARIFDRAGLAVVNADDDRVRTMGGTAARVARFGSTPAADYRLVENEAGAALARGADVWMPCDGLKLAGRHNRINALAVWALAEALGIGEQAICAGLCAFAGLPHRCETVADIDGVRWINDSKGTNLGALMASLDGMAPPVVLLAGGQAKGADFTPLGPLAQNKAKVVIVFGEDRERIAAAVEGRVPVERVNTLRDAVARATTWVESGDTVLFSPGCASFDQFRNYVDRGERFVAAVRELAA